MIKPTCNFIVRVISYVKMGKTGFFSKINNLLGKTELFARPWKQLPGKWSLFEYYYDEEAELFHFTEDQIKSNKHILEVEFLEAETFKINTNLLLPVINGIKNGSWSRYKNFITFISPEDFRDNTEFQFAIDKGTLKLLKKDITGKIEFFGFFRKKSDKNA